MPQNETTAAELTARVSALGLSLNEFAALAPLNPRAMRRQASGAAPVSPRAHELLERLEDRARRDRAGFVERARAGEPILVPPLHHSPPVDGLPALYWHLVAARALEDTDGEARILYAPVERAPEGDGSAPAP